jgi:hypothetical protein
MNLTPAATATPPDVRRGSASPPNSKLRMGLCPWFGLCPCFMGQRPNQGPSPMPFENLSGEAEPRLTSGGEAAADGVKFQDQLDLLRRSLTSGGGAAADGVKFQDQLDLLRRSLTSGGVVATKRALMIYAKPATGAISTSWAGEGPVGALHQKFEEGASGRGLRHPIVVAATPRMNAARFAFIRRS